MEKDKQFYIERAKKAQKNKKQMVTEVVERIMEAPHEYKDVVRDCLYKSFSTSSQHELKIWLWYK